MQLMELEKLRLSRVNRNTTFNSAINGKLAKRWLASIAEGLDIDLRQGTVCVAQSFDAKNTNIHPSLNVAAGG